MALQHKHTVKFDGFVPSRSPSIGNHGVVKAKRWDNFNKWLPSIKWSKLNDQQFASQWGVALNAINTAESDKVVERDDLMSHFVQYLRVMKYTAEQIKLLRNAPDTQVTFSIVSKAYMLMIGNIDHPGCNNTVRFIKRELALVLKRTTVVIEEVPEDNRRAYRKRERISDLIGELQGLEDDQDETDILEFLKEQNVPKEAIQTIEERFRPRKAELEELLTTKDEDLKQAFRHMTRKEVKTYIAWYDRLLEACIEYRGHKVAVRKKPVRKARVVDPSKAVKRIKYLQESTSLGITSLAPHKMLGMQMVWLYNTKYRKLQVYIAQQGKVLSAKGTKLTEWDPKRSFQKTLRNPQEQLAAFEPFRVPGTAMHFFSKLKTSVSPLRGTLTVDTLIMKAMMMPVSE